MIPEPGNILTGCIDALTKQFPGMTRHVKQRVVLSNALRPYRTVANDHLRRALRLSWINAATALFHERLTWAKAYPDVESSKSICAFEPIFEAIKAEHLKLVFNTDSGECIGDSPIDTHLDALIEELPTHLRGGEMTPKLAQSFQATLVEIAGVDESEIPPDLVRAAKDGIAPGTAKNRHFGQLFADEFARVLQDPNYYPEAAGSFEVIQCEAQADLLRELKSELSSIAQNLPNEVSEAVAATLTNIPEDWLGKELRSQLDRMEADLKGVGAGVQDLNNGMRELPGMVAEEVVRIQNQERPDASVLDMHTPSQMRTVMFAGLNASDAIASRHFNRIVDQVSRRAARISESAAILPLQWDFSHSLRREGVEGEYAEVLAWETINDNVIGAVLVLSGALSDAIVPEIGFLTALTHQGWLAPNGPIDDVHHLKGRPLHDFIAHGGIPLSYETRFALECLLRETPLSVIVTSPAIADQSPMASFLEFLQNEGVHVVQAEQTRRDPKWSHAFVSALPGIQSSNIQNPYRALDFYQTDDADKFVGRDREAGYAETDLRVALETGTPLLLGITGPSGCGKSSFLRAGIAAVAQTQYDLVSLDMRPTDFQHEETIGVRCLPMLMAKLSEVSDLGVPDMFLAANAPHRSLLLPKLKELIDDAIKEGVLPRMLICIDQFEEILDDISEKVNDEEWCSLIAIVLHLNRNHGWPVVFTLEDSRKDRFERHKETLGFEAATFLELPDNNDAFFRDVITKPFEQNGIDLDREIVDELLDEVSDLRKQSDTTSSPLPLLALRLSQLFQQLAPRAPKQVQESRLSQSFNRLLVTRKDLYDMSLALGDMISELAETAWTVGGGDDDDAVKYFFRPLVRISIDLEHNGNGKMILKHVQGRGYRAEQMLHDAFRRYRLLVPSVSGHRLVHEAVIRRWPRARKWFEVDRKELEAEARFRSAALGWAAVGQPDIVTPAEDEINLAARILGGHIRDWAVSDCSHLSDEEHALKDYAVAVFEYSATPKKWISDDEPSGAHIHLAASYGLDELIEKFLGIDPEVLHLRHGKTLRTPLGQAGWNHLSTVKILLNNGAKPDSLEENNFTALDTAVWGERPDILKAMLEKADGTAWPENAANPLCGAAHYGNIEIAEMLVEAGFAYDQQSAGDATPLHHAALQSDVSVFQYFLDRGDLATKTNDGRTPLHFAVQVGNLPIIQRILTTKEGAEQLDGEMADWGTPVMMAAYYHHGEVVQQLMSLTSDINRTAEYLHCKGYNALHMAFHRYNNSNTFVLTDFARRKMFETVKQLLSNPKLDVAARSTRSVYQRRATGDDEEGLTAWEMSSGLPDIQRAIAGHPKFPEDRLVELRKVERAKQISRTKDELFDTAMNKNKRGFVSALQNAPDETDLDIKRQQGEDHISVSYKMLENGWQDLIYRMIASGQIDPWAAEEHYPGLYGKALKNGDVALMHHLEETIPQDLPALFATDILVLLQQNQDAMSREEKARVRQLVLDHIDAETASEIIWTFARMGHEGVISDLLEIGADPDQRDDWGREIFDVAPAALRAARGLKAIGGEDQSNQDSAFYPTSPEWEALNDIDLIAAIDKSEEMEWDERVIWSQRKLAFYPDPEALLLRAKHPEWPEAKFLYYLSHGSNLFWLNGTSPPIHEFNAKYTKDFEGENALQYLKFFCFFVRAEHGPFYILDSRNAPYLPNNLESHEAEQANEKFQGLRRWGKAENGNLQVSALVYYSNALFAADFVIQPSGMIELKDDWPIISDLTQKVDAPIS